MPRKPAQYCMVDMGYDGIENMYRCKLIETQEGTGVFGEPFNRALVDQPGGVRLWVDYWTLCD